MFEDREDVGQLGQRCQALESEVNRFRQLFDHLPALIAFWDQDLKNVIANQAYVDWFGMTPDQVRGVHIREVLGEDVYAQNLPFLRAALAGEEQLFSRTLVDPTGRIRHSQASYVPEIVDGVVRGIFVLVTDVTPRVEAQRELDDAQALAKVGSWVYYPRTQEMTWSRELFRIIGKDPEADTPSIASYLDAVHPEDRHRILEQQSVVGNLTGPYEQRYRLKHDDEIRYVHSRGHPEFDSTGTVSRITGTLQDVTEAQLAAQALDGTNMQLAEANQLLSDTIALLSHDIRQPILAVTGFLELATEGWATMPPERLLDLVSRAAVATRRMNTLVDDVLMLVNIDSNVLATRITVIRLADLVREVRDAQALDGDIELQVLSDVLVVADAFHLQQCLGNLVSNAIKYGRPPVSVSVDSGGGRAQIRVTDHGEGVPEDFAPHLFDRFSRAVSGIAATKPGSGFGLYIVKKLIEANHGDIAYEPVEPSGSSFTVTLPLAPDQRAEAPA